MRKPTPTAELEKAYEALRAQAVGQFPAVTPRGLALLLHAGLPAWMAAWVPLAPVSTPSPAAVATEGAPLAGLAAELVKVLSEMALGSRRRCQA
jgi:hypothetical protein